MELFEIQVKNNYHDGINQEFSDLLYDTMIYAIRKENRRSYPIWYMMNEKEDPLDKTVISQMAHKINEYCNDFIGKHKDSPDLSLMEGKFSVYNITVPSDLCNDIKDNFIQALEVNVIAKFYSGKDMYKVYGDNVTNSIYDDSISKSNIVINKEGIPLFEKAYICIDTVGGYSGIWITDNLICELQHVFEDYNRLISKHKTFAESRTRIKYGRAGNTLKHLDKSIKTIFLRLLQAIERKNIENEIQYSFEDIKKAYIEDPFGFSAFDIGRYNIYRQLNTAFNDLNTLRNIEKADDKELIMIAYNEIFKTSVSSYEEVMKILKEDLEYTAKYVLIEMNKRINILHNIYTNYHIVY